MQVHVNSETIELPDGATVRDLVACLRLTGPVAVELNQEIVKRCDHNSRPLHEGDRVEIVTLVGGG